MTAQLKSIKTAHLTHVSRSINSLQGVLEDDEPDIDSVQKYLKMVNEKYEKVVVDSGKLQEVLTDDAELTKEIEDMDTLEDKVITIRFEAEKYLEENKVDSKVKTEGEDLNTTLLTTLLEQMKEDKNKPESDTTLQATLKLIEKLQNESFTKQRSSLLPIMQLPRFDGQLKNIEKYTEFIDSYEAAIRNHPELLDVEKFMLLKNHLDSPAKDLLDGFSTTNDDYAEAFQLFKDTYGNKSLLRQIRISKLLNMEKHDGRSSIRPIYNQIRTHIRSLESLEIVAEEYSLFLVPIVLSKFSTDFNKRWYKPSKRNQESINHLLHWIKEEVESTESAMYLEDAFSGVSDKKNESANKKSYDHKHSYSKSQSHSRSNYSPSTATALHTNTNSQSSKPSNNNKKFCCYCQTDDHDTQTCRNLEKCSSTEVRNFLFNQELCFCCMKKGHSASQCYHKSKLVCKRCNAKGHHTFLHEDKSSIKPSEDKRQVQQSVKTSIQKSTISSSSPIRNVIFQTANAYLTNEEHHREKIKIAFDTCSDKSYVATAASSKVKLGSHEETLDIKGYNGKGDGVKTYTVRHAIIESITRPNTRRSVNLIETDKICAPIRREAIPIDFLECQYLRGLDLAEDYSSSSNDEIDVLIGLDFYWDLITGRVKRKKDKPVIVESILGWILQASSSSGCSLTQQTSATSLCSVSQPPSANSLFITASEGKEINAQLKRFWEIEEVGSNEEVPWSPEETSVHNKFEETISHETDGEKGRYQVTLPVKEDIDKLLSNKAGAITRYRSLKNRLNKNQSLKQQYTAVMEEYIKSGFMEKVIEETEPRKAIYHLPHHPIINEERETTKVRPVFDASASEDNSGGLNTKLYKGRTLQPHLNAITMRFRLNPIAFTADVKKMFLMIKIHPDQRDLLRVIWDDLLDGSQSVYRYTVLPFGLRCSPYLAIATIHHHVRKYAETYPEIVKELLENTYVDDLLSGAKTIEEAIASYETEVKIMKAAGMELRKWSSNHPKLTQRFIEDNVCSTEGEKDFTLDEDKDPTTAKSVLGIRWNSSEDYFTFHEKGILEKANSVRPTKRNILSVSGKVYDPPGWLSPFIIQIKILNQRMWQRGLEWDETLPADLQTTWEEWRSELTMLSHIKIPRYIGSIHKQYAHPVELHTFGDASEDAYAAVSYLKAVDEDGGVYITLMHSKTKVSPIKLVSLPRLELLASLLAAQTAVYVNSSLKIPNLQLYMWTDATVALQWIRGSSRKYKTFVGNRVERIHELTDPSLWGKCPGEENPADIPSRGCPLTSLIHNDFWWYGPAWLKENPEKYPQSTEDDLKSRDEAEKEVKPKYSTSLVTSSSITHKPLQNAATKLINPKYYSNLKTLITTTAHINRYLHNIVSEKEDRIIGPILAEDKQRAKIQWLQYIQQHCFPEDLQLLIQGKNVKKTSKLLQLSPYYDKTDNLMKMGGRIEFSDLSEEEKHPVILPNKSYIVKLIVKDTHHRQLHAGINHTLISLRDNYWIIRARQLVRGVVKSCFICRKINPVRLKVQTAPLPRDRLMQCTPFEVVGVDFTGPLYVYQGAPKEKFDPQLKRKVLSYDGVPCNKMYIGLYTCAVTRAVHLELVWDLTTESFVRSFRRFVSRRGMCRVIYSDNAKTFEKAEKDLKFYLELMSGKQFQSYISEHNIQWKFILQCSPWWGGFYERLMKSIKSPLKKVLGKSRVDVDEMSTMLDEIEAQINSRPLTTVTDEPSEQKYLTPASFLIGRPTMNMPLKPRLTEKLKFPQKDLNKFLRQQNKYLNLVWRTFKEEYQRNVGTVSNKVNASDSVKVGELVMVADQNLPRTVWEVGLVKKLKESKDGRIRTVYLDTASGPKARSVQHLSRLEADSVEDLNQYAC